MGRPNGVCMSTKKDSPHTQASDYFWRKAEIMRSLSMQLSSDAQSELYIQLAEHEWRHGNSLQCERACLNSIASAPASRSAHVSYIKFLFFSASDIMALRHMERLPDVLQNDSKIIALIKKIRNLADGCKEDFACLNSFHPKNQKTIPLTVIVPNYNYGRYLAKRLISITTQSWRPAEIIILDDYSRDSSRKIISEFAKQTIIPVKLVFNGYNSGSPFKQWLKGINLAACELIWIAECDDYCDNSFLEKICPLLNNPEVVMAYADSQPVNERDFKFKLPYKYFFTDDKVDINFKNDFIISGFEFMQHGLINCCCIPNASAMVFRKTAFTADMKDITKFGQSGDWLLWNKLATTGKVAYRAETINFHRVRTGGSAGRPKPFARLKETFRIHEYMLGRFPWLYARQDVARRVLKSIEHEYAAYLFTGANDAPTCATSSQFGKEYDKISIKLQSLTSGKSVAGKISGICASSVMLKPIYMQRKCNNMKNLISQEDTRGIKANLEVSKTTLLTVDANRTSDLQNIGVQTTHGVKNSINNNQYEMAVCAESFEREQTAIPHGKTTVTEKSLSTKEDIKHLAFDPDYYAFIYPEYKDSYAFPLQHYLMSGWRQGNNPSPYFNTVYYLSKHPDALTSGISPAEHFLANNSNDIFPCNVSAKENDASICTHMEDAAFYEAFQAGLFDIEYYCEQYDDVPKGILAAKHYAKHGWKEGRNPSLCFEAGRYAKEYLKNISDINPLLHFVESLPRFVEHPYENRILKLKKKAETDKIFDAHFYRTCNPDLKFNDMQLFFHYLLFGWKEGRNPAQIFNTSLYIDEFSCYAICPIIDYYADSSTDKVDYIKSLHNRYLNLISINENTTNNIRQHMGEITAFALKQRGFFDAAWYNLKYNDVNVANVDPLTHFIMFGIWERRETCDNMNIEFYQKENMPIDSDINPLLHYTFVGQSKGFELVLTPVAAQLLAENKILTRQLQEIQNNLEEYCMRIDAKNDGSHASQTNSNARKKIDDLTTECKAAQQKCKNQLEFFVDQLETIFKRK